MHWKQKAFIQKAAAALTAFSNVEKRPLLASIFFVGWVICGKMPIDRISEALPAIEIRWIFPAIIFCLFPSIFSFRIPKAIVFSIHMGFTIAFFLFFLFSIFWHTPTHLGYLVDVFHILFQIMVLIFLIQEYKKFGLVAAFTIIVIAYSLMIAAFLQINRFPDVYGNGLHSFSSPFTFHRIQFLSLGALIYLATQSSRDSHAASYILFSIPNTISIFLSLSKTSILSLILFEIVVCFLLLRKGQWRLGLVCGIAMIVSWSVFQFDYSRLLIDRIVHAFSAKAEFNASIESDTCPNITEYGGKLGSYYISGNVANIALSYCVDDLSETTSQYDMSCTSICIREKTSRLVLWFESVSRIRDAALLGSGPGNFVVVGRNPYTGAREMQRHPHNIFLEVILGAGVLGGGLFLICIIANLSLFLDMDRLRLGDIPALGGLIYILSGAQLGGDFYDFRLFWLIATAIIYLRQFPVVDPIGGR